MTSMLENVINNFRLGESLLNPSQTDNLELRQELVVDYLGKQTTKALPWLITGEVPTDLATLRGASLHFINMCTTLNYLLHGSKQAPHDTLADFEYDHTSLPRHLNRAWNIATIIFIGLSQKLSQEEIKKLAKVVPAAGLHDLGRVITHTSKHDELLTNVLRTANIHPTIIDALHEPVPVGIKIDPNTFDANNNQLSLSIQLRGIVRVADVNGKLFSGENEFYLLDNPEALRGFSREVQMRYFSNGDPFWENRTKEDLEQYVDQEFQLIKHHTNRWKNEFGFDWFRTVKQINRNPNLLENPLWTHLVYNS